VDEQVLADASQALLDAVEVALAPWVEQRLLARAPHLGPSAGDTARRAADVALAELRRLLTTDIDAQRTTPLQILRDAMAGPTAALSAAGVPPVPRDARQAEVDPDDVYDLGPATWADLGDGVGEAGLVWGAAKAMVHLDRHRDR
jgi:hypothetical protein